MSVDTTARKQSFAGGQKNLSFTFKTLPDHPEYIKVTATSGGVDLILTYSTQYNVTVSTDGVGGTVVIGTTYSTAYTHTVYRETVKKQESDYEDYNQFPADTLEEDLDRRALIEQEISEEGDRSLKLPISSTISSLTIPTPSAGKALKWNAAENGLENTTEDIDDYLTAASNYASTASTQASLASKYATTASTQAALAGNYATTASDAVLATTNASLYASTASTQAALAALYASTASTQATAAATSATLAGLYASTASTQAALAGNYATTASTSATLAGNYATTSSTNATLAGNYATTASAAAVLAGNYAITCSTQAIPSLTGNAGKVLAVSSGELAMVWITATTGGTTGSSGVRGIFTQTTVTTGSMVISYSTLGTAAVLHITIADSNGVMVIPDSITFADTGATVNVTSFMPISGNWRYYYIT